MSDIIHKALPNGLVVAIEHMPSVQSASVNWLVPAGWMREKKKNLGLNAMLSEMLLRGAGSRDSRALADAFDTLGASRAVSPSSLYMKLSLTSLGAKLHDALELLADIALRPIMPESSVDQARDLALQSLASLEDEPQERCSIAARKLHHPEPLSHDGYGTPETLASITREDMEGFWRDHARPGGSILCIAGAVDPAKALAHVEQLTSGWEGSTPEPEYDHVGQRGYGHITADTNQCQVIILHDAPNEASDDAPLERALTSVLSGGMSGRLFTEVREKRGLCYSVHASYQAGKRFGGVGASVGTTPDKAQESLTVLLEQLRELEDGKRPVEQDEFDRMMIGLRSRTVFSGESAAARAAQLAWDIHRLGRPRTLNELIERVQSVSLDALNAYASARSLGNITVQTLGPGKLDPGDLASTPAETSA